MKPEKKGQLAGGVMGLLLGGIAAYLLWGFRPPGGILILAGSGVGGAVGYGLAGGRL